MNLKYPLCREAYELSLKIEKLPASKEQTDASMAASELGCHIEATLDAIAEHALHVNVLNPTAMHTALQRIHALATKEGA